MVLKQRAVNIDFEDFLRRRREPEWLAELRRSFWRRFLETPTPTRRDEEWRYTDVTGFTTATPQDFSVTISAPENVVVLPLTAAVRTHEELVKRYLCSALERADKFTLFGAAVWTDGYMVFVPRGADVKEPVVIRHTAEQPAASHALVVAEEGSRVAVYELFEGSAPTHYGLLEVFPSDNAEVNVFTIQRFSENTWDYSCKKGTCARDARLNWTFALLGGRTTKLKAENLFQGQGSSAELRGVYFGTDSQHFSILTSCYHETQNTRANVATKGVLKDKASSLTRGLIRIERVARGTDSFLSDKTLHLSAGAVSNAIPSLEIENNDVRASHGASTGKIDEQQLFYMMTRGVTREEAVTLIVQGFFEPVVDAIAVEVIREGVRGAIQNKIARAGEQAI